MRNVSFESNAWEEFADWQSRDPKTWKKIVSLIGEAVRTPFQGTGKPEPLKHTYKGYWSRRIDREHRLIYRVSETGITIASCRGHYE